MKKILLVLSVILSLAVSCRKVDFVIGDNPFTIEVKNIYARAVWVDILPENNDFYFYYDIVSLNDFSEFDSDADFVSYVDGQNREMYDILVEYGYTDPFEELMLYRSAILEPYYGNDVLLEPETDYYLYAFAYDKNLNAIGTLHKVKFRTPKEVHSENTFTVVLNGDYITVTPSNDDQYLFDFATEKELKELYYGMPEYYFSQMIDVYEQYGFMDSMVSQGEDTDYLFDYYTTIDDGEKIYVMVAGYDHGLTTDVSIHEFTYSARK